MKKILYLLFILFLLISCDDNPENGKLTYLDSLEFDHIVNLYGPPHKNLSFAKDTININKVKYERGLGLHAPAKLVIDLDGKAKRFYTEFGIDTKAKKLLDPDLMTTIENFPDYVYDNQADHYDLSKGSTVKLKIVVNGDTLYKSPLTEVFDDARIVDLRLKGAEKIEIIADPLSDGSFADHVNLANAYIEWKKLPENLPSIYNYPEEILVNHAGFMPESKKTCFLAGTEQKEFKLIDQITGKQVYKGTMIPEKGDLGNYLVGDFSNFTKKGRYYIQSGKHKSVDFNISSDIYLKALKKHIKYIHQQRSGDPDNGWAKGQHLDDGIRDDNGKHQNVTGGWYDACDIRKPMSGNALLLFALASVAESDFPGFDKMELLEEIKWGNKFLFAMTESEGYVMNYIGSTKHGYKDNRWTDNIPGNDDDRTILTKPAQLNDQLIFTLANTKIFNFYRDEAPVYSEKCLDYAVNTWKWIQNNKKLSSPNDIGLAISTSLALFKATGDIQYKEEATFLVKELLEKQNFSDEVITGHFFNFSEKARVYSGRWIMMGFEDFINTLNEHKLNERVKRSMKKFTEGYYINLAQTNSFSVIPWVFSTKDLGSEKQIGPYYYRNFLHVGMNQHLSSQGCALMAASEVLANEDYEKLAQNQLDWIYGANPFNASSVTGIGYNQPTLFKTMPAEFKPHTPELAGGVMTGIGSNENDKIAFFPGYWWTTEYWSPTVTYTILLVTKLAKSNLK